MVESLSDCIDHTDRYDDLYVVSDIHMGGERTPVSSFQIFNQGNRLSKFINHITAPKQNRTVGLVLNGDIFDSLAESSMKPCCYTALDEQTALEIIHRIIHDNAFNPVWQALKKFLETKQRHVILVIGNHDIELALPPVRSYIRRYLCSDNESALSRLVFASAGGGYSCLVGEARVFCTHGNEVDGWNKVDFDKLSQLSNAMNGGREVEPKNWEPNAGTRLVIDCMNKVKKEWPFVDLLKPETLPVFSVLATFDLGLITKLARRLPKVLFERAKGMSAVADLLSAHPEAFESDTSESTLLLVDHLKPSSGTRSSENVEDELLLEAGIHIHSGASSLDTTEGTLGLVDDIRNVVRTVSLPFRSDPVEALRQSLLGWLEDDQTFDPGFSAKADQDTIQRADSKVNFIIAGHTHLARAIEVLPNHQYYFNCGTWIRLIRFTNKALASDVFEEKVVPALKARSLEALDKSEIPGPDGEPTGLIYDRTNVVHISRKQKTVVGALLRVIDAEKGPGIKIISESDYAPDPSTKPFEFEVSP